MNLWTRFNGLRFQIVVLLTVALLPLGAIAIYQTNRVEAEARRSAQLSVLALTERAAKAEELIIEGAFGAARFLATIAPDLLQNPETCSPQLSRFIADNPVYGAVDIVPLSGRTTCNSLGELRDFSGVESFEAALKARIPLEKIDEGSGTDIRSVFRVFQPFDVQDDFGGVVILTVPHKGKHDIPDRIENLGLTELATFNGNGVFLTARGGLEQAEQERPQNRDMTELVLETATVFEARNQRGNPRIYTIVPIERSPVSVMGVWRAQQGVGNQIGAQISAAFFPLLMWTASMAVAILSIHRLVLRHISSLSKSMGTFAENRSTKDPVDTPAMPNELVALTDNFSQMTDDILHDEAKLQDALHEKNVLIKEVHHRVKNNLQLISSIMNMQIRAARHDETKAVLSSLQDRVLSLATIHRDLYQSQNQGMVDARELIVSSCLAALICMFMMDEISWRLFLTR